MYGRNVLSWNISSALFACGRFCVGRSLKEVVGLLVCFWQKEEQSDFLSKVLDGVSVMLANLLRKRTSKQWRVIAVWMVWIMAFGTMCHRLVWVCLSMVPLWIWRGLEVIKWYIRWLTWWQVWVKSTGSLSSVLKLQLQSCTPGSRQHESTYCIYSDKLFFVPVCFSVHIMSSHCLKEEFHVLLNRVFS